MANSIAHVLENCCNPLWWETCVDCGNTVNDQHGDWCINCGGWICDKDWEEHKKYCLAKKH